jgi:hypothetical protein
MYEYVTDNVLNAIYAPNDRLGVELMGAIKWNALKKVVAQKTVNKLNKTYSGSRTKFLEAARRAARNSTVNSSGDPIKAVQRFRKSMKYTPAGFLNDPLCAELWGINDDYAAELLGSYGWSDFTRQVKNVTHKALEAGENIPVIDAAVSRFRDIENVFSTGSKAADTAQTVYDNRGKIILIGGLGAFGLYLLLRNKK